MNNKEKKRTMVSVLFMQFSIVVTVCLIASNILETSEDVYDNDVSYNIFAIFKRQ